MHSVRRKLEHQEAPWSDIAGWLLDGHVEYQPIRNNPMRSGYSYMYQKAGLNLTLYYPEKIFNRLLDLLDKKKVGLLKIAFQASFPERSGYVLNEFKIRGVIEDDLSEE